MQQITARLNSTLQRSDVASYFCRSFGKMPIMQYLRHSMFLEIVHCLLRKSSKLKDFILPFAYNQLQLPVALFNEQVAWLFYGYINSSHLFNLRYKCKIKTKCTKQSLLFIFNFFSICYWYLLVYLSRYLDQETAK